MPYNRKAAVEDFWELLLARRRESPFEVLVSTHDLRFVRAHADWIETGVRLKETLLKHLEELKSLEVDDLRQARWTKFESMGAWLGEDAEAGA